MPITLRHESDDLYQLAIQGLLRQPELDRCQNALAQEIERIGPVKLLVLLEQFEGWDRAGDWNDMTFYLRHGDDLARIAIVGPERWREESLMFAAADLRKGPVEFFPEGAVDAARAWLSPDNRARTAE